MIRCPICTQSLYKQEKQYRCQNNHSFDIAKEGYVNLLLKNSTNHGDNKQMVAARTQFLQKGYYQPLAEKLQSLIAILQPDVSVIADLGCGQGYYTNQIQHAFPQTQILGIDISKEAVASASKQNKQIQYLVASNAALPLASHTVDVALCLFSFQDFQETWRILKPGGILVIVSPHTNHLWELKQAVYDTPYLNEIKTASDPGFSLIREECLTYPLTIPTKEDIQELFSMTPYFYKTSPKDHAKLEQLTSLKLHASFQIVIYQAI